VSFPLAMAGVRPPCGPGEAEPGPGVPELSGVSIPGVARLLEAAGAQELLGWWLTPAERAELARLEVPKRRHDWLSGRVAAKDAVRRRHGLAGPDAFLRVQVAAVSSGPESGRPFYRLDGQQGRFGLSISHSGDTALAALARHEGQAVGVDLEQVEPREASFEAIALSERELQGLEGLGGGERAREVTRLWALKEALAKALGTGLRLPLTQVTARVAQQSAPAPEAGFEADGPGAAALAAALGRGRISARSFCMGGALAAWVVLQPGAQR
jgi:phosphopantetheinyl transferase